MRTPQRYTAGSRQSTKVEMIHHTGTEAVRDAVIAAVKAVTHEEFYNSMIHK